MDNTRIKFSYRVDKRIKSAQLENNSVVMLVPLSDFQEVSNILYFEESTGTILLTSDEFIKLWGIAQWKSQKRT